MTIETVRAVGPRLGIAPTCVALGLPPATYYRRISPKPPLPEPRLSPPRKLAAAERTAVLEVLHEPEFVDLAPGQVYAQLLDAERYLCSERTMYRILEAHHEVRERRDQLRHPPYAAPELLATAPNQVWSWDITKLLGPAKWTYFYLYVILDLFSRYVVGWMVAHHESAALAKKLIEHSCRRQGIPPGQLTLHADRGPSMTSKPVALLLSDLGVTKTHSRPYVSNDNPFSEAQFKTLKYRPDFPDRFGSIQHARGHGHVFFPWYNTAHRHSGLGMLTPHEVHYGLAEQRVQARARVLAAAFAAHPERFVAGRPRPPALPTEVWINKPKAALTEPERDSEPEVVTNFASRAPHRPAADSTHPQVSPRISVWEQFGSIDGDLRIAAVAPLNTEDTH
jgi:putative transposase